MLFSIYSYVKKCAFVAHSSLICCCRGRSINIYIYFYTFVIHWPNYFQQWCSYSLNGGENNVPFFLNVAWMNEWTMNDDSVNRKQIARVHLFGLYVYEYVHVHRVSIKCTYVCNGRFRERERERERETRKLSLFFPPKMWKGNYCTAVKSKIRNTSAELLTSHQNLKL